MQAVSLSPEICIVVDNRIILLMREKADALHAAEGISPGCGMANVQDTTGV
jgi:hypothetical protein